MKTRLTILASVVLMIMTACTSSRMVAGPNVSIYTEIPLAPNIVLTVETPVISSPGSDYLWVDGYWTWDYRYREYVWVQGHWTLAPYAGAFWIPGYWEYYRGGYRWIDASWLPRDHRLAYGYYNGRYDYYGRPVYYHRPHRAYTGYAYTYDNRPEYRSKGYSSSPRFNDTPKNERTRITREYQQQSRSSAHPANTDRNRQETIRIRESNTQGSRESSTQRQTGAEGNRTPATTTPNRTQPDNNRSTGNSNNSSRNSENRSSGNSGSGVSRSSSSGESRVRENNNSASQSQSRSSSSSSGSSSSSNTRSSSSGSGRR